MAKGEKPQKKKKKAGSQRVGSQNRNPLFVPPNTSPIPFPSKRTKKRERRNKPKPGKKKGTYMIPPLDQQTQTRIENAEREWREGRRGEGEEGEINRMALNPFCKNSLRELCCREGEGG